MTPTDLVRREIARAAAAVRPAFRAILGALRLDASIQRAGGEGLAGESLEERDLFQQFGFTSAPPAGSQAIVIPIGGRSSAAVVIATEHGAYRFKLGARGEMAIYNQWGDFVHLKADRSIHVVAQVKVLVETDRVEFRAGTEFRVTTKNVVFDASAGAQFNTPILRASQDIVAGGNISDAGGAKSMSGMRQVFDTHTHPENDRGGPTSDPIQKM